MSIDGQAEDINVRGTLPETGRLCGQRPTVISVTTAKPAPRVLVVGINYAPEQTGIAPYTTQACEYLKRHGAEVLVLAGVPHYPHWSVPTDYRHRLRVDEVRHGVPVRRLRHFVPHRQSAFRRGAYEASFGLRVLGQRLPWKPEVVLAVVPSLLGATAASAIAGRYKARLVVWVQDLMGRAAARSGIPGGSRVAAATESLEAQLLCRADEVIVLNEAFRAYVESLGVPGHQVHVVRNWTHIRPAVGIRNEVRRRLGWGDDEVVALHAGNMGLKQGLDSVIEAARLAAIHAPHVRFVLMGDGSQRRVLEERGADVPAITFLPPTSERYFPEVLAAADVLLVTERASAIDMSLPSKLTSYFLAGVPVLAAVPGGGGTAHEVSCSGAGAVVAPDDANALLAGVLTLAQDDAQRRRCRVAAAAHVDKYMSSATALLELARLL